MRRPWTPVACVLILAVAGATYLGYAPGTGDADPEASPGGARILRDTTGEIELVVCKLDSSRRRTLGNARLVSNIINALPSRVEFLVLTNDRAAFTITPTDPSDRVRFVQLPEETSTTIWPQDPFLVLREGRANVRLLVSKQFNRADDRVIAEHVARHLGLEIDASELDFEGGNLVAGDRHVFIGGDTISANVEAFEETPEEVIARFEEELGRAVVVIGTSGQPVGHIDMILTPLGDGRLLLADAGWGARLAEEALAKMRADVDAFERQCERMFFGHPSIRELRSAGGTVFRPPPVIGETKQAIADSRGIAAKLDRWAEALAEYGYLVDRVPFLFAHLRGDAASSTAAAGARETPTPSTALLTGSSGKPHERSDARSSYGPGYPMLTYNNVLAERAGNVRTVYLPRYGFRMLDQAAARVWRDLGWRVQAVGGLTISAMHRGSLRCCVKVLRREEVTREARGPTGSPPAGSPRRFEIADATLHTNLGIALKSDGKLREAAREFRRALELQPDDAMAHTNLGNVLQLEGKVVEAIQHFQKALEREPASSDLYVNLANALFLRGEIEKAVRTYHRALEITPRDARAHVNLGVVLREQGDVRGALEHFREALRTETEQFEAHFNLGLTLLDSGKIEEAIGHYRHALRIRPDHEEARAKFRAALELEGQPESP